MDLEPGEEHVLEWGGPLRGDFTYGLQGDQLTVHPSVRFFGKSGAEYHDFAPVVRSPMLKVRNSETGNLRQYGRFGGGRGGGHSARQVTGLTGVEFVIELEHERRLFGVIEGIGRPKNKTDRED